MNFFYNVITINYSILITFFLGKSFLMLVLDVCHIPIH